MKVSVDRSLCNGYGNCVMEAPEVFELDDEGMAVVLDESPTGENAEKAKTAAAMCPVDAILLQNESS